MSCQAAPSISGVLPAKRIGPVLYPAFSPACTRSGFWSRRQVLNATLRVRRREASFSASLSGGLAAMVRFKSWPRWLGVNRLRGTTGIIGLGSGFTGASAMPVLLALPGLLVTGGGLRAAVLAFSILRRAALPSNVWGRLLVQLGFSGLRIWRGSKYLRPGFGHRQPSGQVGLVGVASPGRLCVCIGRR